METFNLKMLNDHQLQQLAELIIEKDKFDQMNNRVPSATFESSRIFPVSSSKSIKGGEEADRKRLIL